MNTRKALELAIGAARVRQLRFAEPHAYQRMQKRGATQADVAEAIMTARQAQPSDDGPNRWRLIGGRDLDGEPLNVVVAIQGSCVTVITLIGD